MNNQTMTLDYFAGLLDEEDLTKKERETILAILAEIKPHATAFHYNTPELVELATLYSPIFQALPAKKTALITSVLKMPIFTFTLPLSEEEADQWMKENK